MYRLFCWWVVFLISYVLSHVGGASINVYPKQIQALVQDQLTGGVPMEDDGHNSTSCMFLEWPVEEGENFTDQINNLCITFQCVNGTPIPIHYQCRSYEGLCIEVNETYLDTYNCTTNTCVKENDTYHLITLDQGCKYGPRCFSLNEIYTYQCIQRRCEIHDNVYGMYIIKEGCSYGDEEEYGPCLKPGEQITYQCRTYSCDKVTDNGEPSYFATLLASLCVDVSGVCRPNGSLVEIEVWAGGPPENTTYLNCTCELIGPTDTYRCP